MKNISTTLRVICSSLLLLSFSAYGTPHKTATKLSKEIPIQLQYTLPSGLIRYSNLDYGINVIVSDESTNYEIRGKKIKYNYTFSPSKEDFVRESLKRYMRNRGFRVDNTTDADYVLNVTIESFTTSWPTNHSYHVEIKLNIALYDSSNNIVYNSSPLVNKYLENITPNSEIRSSMFNKAYAKALEQIEWDVIASLLRQPKQATQQQTAQVHGLGTTALEHTIINWEVTSRPAGADLYWRVISSTPDVKNTNKNYKSTTPYESTESFDIRGLTYQNSGDVQIELTCEKAGYLPQRKVFNVRMVIDQKSINAHFTLVKDE